MEREDGVSENERKGCRGSKREREWGMRGMRERGGEGELAGTWTEPQGTQAESMKEQVGKKSQTVEHSPAINCLGNSG